MDILNNCDILVVQNNIRNKIIEKVNQEGLVNIKIMSLSEIRDKYYFTYDESAVYYLIKNYNYNINVARMYLDNIRYVVDDDFGDKKIRKIIVLKEELKENKLLNYNANFREYLKNKRIVIYNYHNLSKDDNKLIDELKECNSVLFYNDEEKEYQHEFIYQADTLEEEVSFVAGDIVKKINEGISINKIKLCGVVGEYASVIKRIFKWYNIPISINDSTLYSTKIGQDFLENLTSDSSEVINYLKDVYDKDDEALNLINRIVKILNKYVWLDDFLEGRELIVDELKKTKISNVVYTNEVSIVNSLKEVEDDDYVYLLGFNQGDIPKSYKDEQYFNDIELEKLGLDTTFDLNKKEYDKWLFDIRTTKNLIITFKKNSSLGEHYLSSLNDDLKLEIKKVSVSYDCSNLYNKIMLVEKLDKLVKYNEKSDDLEYLYGNYKDIEYNSYDSSYKKIDSKRLEEYLNKKLVLSYSAMNTYYQCSFRYYLANILKLNIYEETFYTVLGNLFHYVLSNYYKEDFDLEVFYEKFLKTSTYQFDAREKFFLDYLKGELDFIINTIKKQNETNSLKRILAEEKIEIDKSTRDMNVIFKGFIDKIMLNDNNDVMAIIDYKTGNPKLNLNNAIYGLDLQLPVYIYLAKNRFPNARVAGFYLQKILNNEIVKDFKNSYDVLKEDKLKLQGYSNLDVDVLEQFDSGYYESKVIKGMKTSSKGISSKKVLDDEKINKLASITEEKIEEAIDKIAGAKFDINPKRIGMDNVGCEFCAFRDICFMKEEMIENLKEYKNMEFLGGVDDDTD